MIYHILNAEVYHHVPYIIEEFLKYAHKTNIHGIQEHFFILRLNNNKRNKSQYKISSYETIFQHYNTTNYKVIQSSFKIIIQFSKISNHDSIIIHDNHLLFGSSKIFYCLLFILGLKFRQRSSIVLWGVSEYKPKNKNILYGLLNKLKIKVMQSVKYVVTLSSDDAKKMKDWYKLENLLITGYIRDSYKEFSEHNIYPVLANKTIKIMISHSAHVHNNQIDVFNMLKKFKDEDILIICPLSYGKREYSLKVKETGIQIFKDKVTFVEDLMPRSEYNSFLNSIDIYISNAVIQTGLYVINFCICTGKKLYLRDNNFNWIVQQGFKANNVSELVNVDFIEFKKPVDEKVLIHNKYLASLVYSADHTIKDWQRIFNL